MTHLEAAGRKNRDPAEVKFAAELRQQRSHLRLSDKRMTNSTAGAGTAGMKPPPVRTLVLEGHMKELQ
jgi:hypothetical protein